MEISQGHILIAVVLINSLSAGRVGAFKVEEMRQIAEWQKDMKKVFVTNLWLTTSFLTFTVFDFFLVSNSWEFVFPVGEVCVFEP